MTACRVVLWLQQSAARAAYMGKYLPRHEETQDQQEDR